MKPSPRQALNYKDVIRGGVSIRAVGRYLT
jgi:hypothetical protein